MSTLAPAELVERIWERDPSVWTGRAEAHWLGWLDEPARMRERTLDRGLDEAERVLEELARVGVDYDGVTDTLEQEGVQKFADSFEELLEGIRSKRSELAAA